MSAPPAPRLRVRNLSQTFGTTRVLHDVDLEVAPGEIHALVGQNGSGKSTFAKVLTGFNRPDEGTVIEIDGRPLPLPIRPHQAREYGMSVVHQSLGLMNGLTVLENMRMGRLKGRGPFQWINWKHEAAEAQAMFDYIGRQVPLDMKVGQLTEDDRALVAISRTLQDATPGTGLIVFDESTRALGRRALENFFKDLDDIVATGTSVLLITHRLEEVLDGADRVSVLRDGRIVESGREVDGMTEKDLTAMILGRNLADLDQRETVTVAEGAPEVRIEGVSGEHISDISFSVRRGEVLGLTGLAGSGFEELPYLVTGAQPASSGNVVLPDATVPLPGLTPARAIKHGVNLVPEGREHGGLALGLTVQENTVFPQTARSRAKLLPVSRSAESELTATWIDRLDVRPRRPHQTVGTLSGGNQQKVFISKWFAMNPKLLMLHEPTQAVDVGARHIIVDAIREAAAEDTFVVVASTDENELALLCDRILVFSDGEIRAELTEDITPDAIVETIYAGGSRARLRERAKDAHVPPQWQEVEDHG